MRRRNISVRFIEALEGRWLLAGDVRFAVIGDFGANTPEEGAVANRIRTWNPDLIITVGDNNYQLGQASTIDANIGKYYHDFIYPYNGAYGAGSADGINHFFPTLGNHEWMQPNAQPHLDYFTLPGNERYYTFRQGAVQFFAIDADPHEPDLGTVNMMTSAENSVEGQWLKNELAASTSPWKIVYFHHPAYSSGTTHGSSPWMQWPFEQWGADAVLTGHEHNFERLNIGGIPYFVNGLGGAQNVYTTFKNPPVAGSAVRYSGDFGAMLVDANDTTAAFQFITRAGSVIDSYTLAPPTMAPAAPGFLSATPTSTTQVQLSWRDQSSNETAFEIWRSTDNVNFTPYATTAANVTGFTDSSASGTHYYHVRATNSGGESAFSNTAASNAPVAAPSNLAATALSSSQIRLSWRDNSNNESRFEIWRSTDNLTFINIATAPMDATSFTDQGLTAGKLYYYRVRAANAVAASTFSNTASAVTSTGTPAALATPTNLTATVVSSSQVRLNWQDNSTAESRFEIWRSTNNSTFTWRGQVGANLTTFTDSGLTAGTTYYYRVRASNPTGNSPFSNTASATPGGAVTVPTAPANLTAAALSSSQIQLTWTDTSSNEISFEVWRSTDGTNFALRSSVGANVTNFVDSGLLAGTRYYYRVRAANSAGSSAFSNTASAMTTTTAVPAAPTNLTARAISSSQIQLIWQDNSTNEGRFEIFRSTNGTTFTFLAQVAPNVTTFTNSGLTAGTTYYYRVRAVNAAGNSGSTNVASATTPGTGTAIPAAPSNLTAAVASATQINLNWTDSSTNETAFQIFRSTDGVNFAQIATVASNVTNFSNTGLVTGQLYYYRVRAANSVGASGFSNTVSARPTTITSGVPVGPTNLTARGVAAGQIQLTWQDNSNNENRFEIFRGSNGTSFTFLAQVGADVTNFTNTGLTPGATYYYRVRAVNSAGNSTSTNVASAVASAPPTATMARTFSTMAIASAGAALSDSEIVTAASAGSACSLHPNLARQQSSLLASPGSSVLS